MAFYIGRIAQLVERLSYTQVVIGSSPVAPKNSYAGVVQLVRAPPCHGGSCGFEPRLPRMYEREQQAKVLACVQGESFRFSENRRPGGRRGKPHLLNFEREKFSRILFHFLTNIANPIILNFQL